MKKILFLFLILLSITGCSKDDENIPLVATISLDKKEITLQAGESYKFKVSHTPDNAESPSLNWDIHDIKFDFISNDFSKPNNFPGPTISSDGILTSSRACTFELAVYTINPGSEYVSDICKVRFTPSIEEIYEYKYCGFKVKDTTDLIVMGCNALASNNDITYLSGTKNKKLWVGKFETSSKKQLKEFIDYDQINLVRKINLGYGEYSTFTVLNMEIKSFIEHDKGWVSEIRLFDKNKPETNDYSVFVFGTNDLSKKYFCHGWDYGEGITQWYNESYIALVDTKQEDGRNGIYTCFDYKGNVIFSQRSNYILKGRSFPIDYKKVIFFDSGEFNEQPCINVRLLSIDNPNFPIWDYTRLFIPKSLDYKYNIRLLDKNQDIYTFLFDFIEYSGVNHSHKIEINIVTGEFNEI